MLHRGMFIVCGLAFLALPTFTGGKDNSETTNRPEMTEKVKVSSSPEPSSLFSQHITNISQTTTISITTIHPLTTDQKTPEDIPSNVSMKQNTVPRYLVEEVTVGTDVQVTTDIKILGHTEPFMIFPTTSQVFENKRTPVTVLNVVGKPKHLSEHSSFSTIERINSTLPSINNISVDTNYEVKCQSEKDKEVWWDGRKVGTLAVQPCITGYHGNIYRRCYIGGIWGTSDYTDCKLERLQRLGRLVLYHLHKRLLTGLYHLAEELADYLPVANVLSPVDRLQTIDVLEKMATAEVNLRAGSDSDVAYVADLLQCADELLTRKNVFFSSASDRNKLLSMKSSQAILGLEILAQKALHSLLGVERRALVFRSSENIVMSLFSKQTSVDHIWPYKNKTEEKDDSFPVFLNIQYSDVENMAFSFIWIQHLGKLLDTAKMMLNSDIVIATTISVSSVSSPSIPFEVTLKMQKEEGEENYVHGCGVLRNSTKIWSTEECYVIYRKKSSITCHCRNLAAVALILRKSEDNSKEYPSHSISGVIVAGCGLSLIAVLLTLFAHINRCRKSCPESSPILLNLLIAMATIQVVFMAGINATQHQDVCYSVSIILHYLFLVASFWMVSFTVQLYRRLRNSSQKMRHRVRSYFLLSWIVPIALVAVSIIVNPRGYEIERYCWLSIQRGMLISFIVPISLLILINTIFMVLVLKTFFQQRPVTHMSEIEKTRVSLRAGVTLLPFFAVNWFFGVLALEDASTTIFQYAFAFSNSLQGVLIFIFYCCMDVEVRRSLKTRFVRRKKKRRNSAIKLKKGCFLCSREQSVVSVDEEGGRPLLADGPAPTSIQTDQDQEKLQNFVRGYSV